MDSSSDINLSSRCDHLIKQFQQIRQQTVAICSPLETEDYVVQPSPEVSPPKWHLGHTSWLFEEVILKQYQQDYVVYNPAFSVLFNSYYKAAGQHTIQAERGYLSRPTVAEIMRYRDHIDTQLLNLLKQGALSAEVLSLIETGLHHEQQHQELLYMDIKYILASNQYLPVYQPATLDDAPEPQQHWQSFEEGLYEIGYQGQGFSYDNERPHHQYYLYPFAVRDSLISNGEYLAFINDHGYTQPQYWLSQGWDWVNQHAIRHPLYWVTKDDGWYEYTLHGLIPLDMHKPVAHISYFEADAFANWQGHRLPTEYELETFLNQTEIEIDSEHLHPINTNINNGQLWCWTRSQYSPYPRFKTFDGVLKEYNGKFMCNQFVLKGGCIATPANHYRHTYRNFYLPHQRWMFSGIRLAKDIH